MPNRLVATIMRKQQPRVLNRDVKPHIDYSKAEALTKVGTDSDSERDSLIESCRVEELRDKFIQPSQFNA